MFFKTLHPGTHKVRLLTITSSPTSQQYIHTAILTHTRPLCFVFQVLIRQKLAGFFCFQARGLLGLRLRLFIVETLLVFHQIFDSFAWVWSEFCCVSFSPSDVCSLLCVGVTISTLLLAIYVCSIPLNPLPFACVIDWVYLCVYCVLNYCSS